MEELIQKVRELQTYISNYNKEHNKVIGLEMGCLDDDKEICISLNEVDKDMRYYETTQGEADDQVVSVKHYGKVIDGVRIESALIAVINDNSQHYMS